MDNHNFLRRKWDIMSRGNPYSSSGLDGALADISLLVNEDVLRYKGATKTGDEHCLLEVRFRPASREVDAQTIAEELERAFVQDIKFGSEAHLISRQGNLVLLDFVYGSTARGSSFVTGRITVDLEDIPRLPRAGRRRSWPKAW